MRPRCIVCARRPGPHGEFLYYRSDGSEVWLCGRKRCAETYNG
jgi:hypothetical protein